jgi:hypothetical protein
MSYRDKGLHLVELDQGEAVNQKGLHVDWQDSQHMAEGNQLNLRRCHLSQHSQRRLLMFFQMFQSSTRHLASHPMCRLTEMCTLS